MKILLWSTAAMAAGFLLDRLFGDPYWLPHIVRWMGRLIGALETVIRRTLPKTSRAEITGGIILVCLMSLAWFLTLFCVLILLYSVSPVLGFVLESFLCYQLLAAKSLKFESMKVYYSLKSGDAEGARKNVSMIVGRDTSALDEDGITRAAAETVAENASDGVVAPLIFIMLGGAALGCLYKAVNTMDSMVGYKNEKYLYFGRAAAKLDDFLNYIPSRLCAVLMIASAFFLRFDARNAYRIWRRDSRNHASPNSAQTESVCAGALGIRLAGPAVYFGKTLDKPYIGDDTRRVKPEDILSANRLMYAASLFMLVIAVALRIVWVI